MPSRTVKLPLGSLSLPWSRKKVYHLAVSLPSNKATGSPAWAEGRIATHNISRPRARIMGISVVVLVGVTEHTNAKDSGNGKPGHRRRKQRPLCVCGQIVSGRLASPEAKKKAKTHALSQWRSVPAPFLPFR